MAFDFKPIPLDEALAIEQVRDYAIFMVDPEGRAASWNEGVLRVLGWPENEWLGQPAKVTFPPGQEKDAEAELETARKTGCANDDRWMARRDGSLFFANGVTTAVFADGTHQGFLKVMRDQTAQHELMQSLARADRRKDEFLATLAHELRNPLAPLRNALHILRNTQAKPTTIAGAIGMMERQLGYLIHLIDDLMDISRITHGKFQLREETVGLGGIVDDAIELSRQAIALGEHELRVEKPQNPVYLKCDPIRLSQVLTNLLINSAKYTPPRGLIVLKVREDGEEVVFTVADNGIGLSQEAMGEVFEMFTQIKAAHQAPLGLGIGLSLARRLVEMHGGTITAASPGEGQGTTFTVRLPLYSDLGPDNRQRLSEAPNARSSAPME